MKTFRVVLVSANTNSFGLNQLVFLSTGVDREAFKACICLSSPPENRTKYARGTTHQFNTQNFPFNLPHMELPEALPPCPVGIFISLHEKAVSSLTKASPSPTIPANPNE